MGSHIVVIGGGPAGSSIAILCRRMGLHVTLVDASRMRFSPGEALPRGVGEYFKNLGVHERLITPERIRYQGLDYRWGTQERNWDAQAEFRQEGIQIPRDVLDKTLLERAREVGVEVMQPCTAKALMTKNGRICGLLTSQGEVSADFVIDAGGSRHWLARKLRMAMQFFSPEMFGYYGWAEGRCPERERCPLIVSDEQGWLFTSRVDEDLYQFSRMSFSPLELGSDWLPPEFKACKMRAVQPVSGGKARPDGRLRGADLTWRRVFQAAGPGFFQELSASSGVTYGF